MRKQSRNPDSLKNDFLKCPKCESTTLEIVEYSDVVDFRGMELDVENLLCTRCIACRNIFLTPEQLKKNAEVTRAQYAIERDHIRERDGLLSSGQIEQIRKSLNLSQREAAKLFGGGPNAFNKYESGEVLQSVSMDKLLRLSMAIGEIAIEILQHNYNPPIRYAFFKSLYPKHDGSDISFSIESFKGSVDMIKVQNSFLQQPQLSSESAIEFGLH